MTPEVKKRYDDALERLRGVVANTGVSRDLIQALVRDTAKKIEGALRRDPDADFGVFIEAFRDEVESVAMENMRRAAYAAFAGDEDGGMAAEMSLALTFVRTDVAEPVRRYADALSQEVSWFLAGGFSYAALRSYLKDPLGFITAESMKPMPKGKTARQSEGRMALAPAFIDGKRKRSLSEVIADFRRSVPAVGAGNSYQVGRSVWTLLNVTSMRAYEDALVMRWAGIGAIGYYVFRASRYDCPLCDDECGFLHPLTEMVVPVHPNCVCVTVEAYEGETPEDFEIRG